MANMMPTPNPQDIPTPGDNVDNPQQPDPQMLQEMQQGQQQQPQDPIQVVTQLLMQVASKVPQHELAIEVQTKAVLTLAQAIKTLTDAANPQQGGVDPQILGQIEVQKAQHDMKLKEVELQHKMQLSQAELQIKAQMTQAKIQGEQQKVQVQTAQAHQDALLKERDAQVKQTVAAQSAQMQAAQAEQKLMQNEAKHKKEMAAPSPAKSAHAGSAK